MYERNPCLWTTKANNKIQIITYFAIHTFNIYFGFRNDANNIFNANASFLIVHQIQWILQFFMAWLQIEG
jgi:hypothetical protein